jgi:hypothetical protein
VIKTGRPEGSNCINIEILAVIFIISIIKNHPINLHVLFPAIRQVKRLRLANKHDRFPKIKLVVKNILNFALKSNFKNNKKRIF